MIAARVPDAPADFTLLSSTATTIEFEWATPYNGGSEILYYKVYWDNGDGLSVFSHLAYTFGPDTNFIVNSGLTSGVFYQFKVLAVNGVGESPSSNAENYISADGPS